MKASQKVLKFKKETKNVIENREHVEYAILLQVQVCQQRLLTAALTGAVGVVHSRLSTRPSVLLQLSDTNDDGDVHQEYVERTRNRA